MISIDQRLRRLEAGAKSNEGWQLNEPLPPVDLDGDGIWAQLNRIRENHQDPKVRNMSLMEMAEDLCPGFTARVRRAGADYEASHEWQWFNGLCYIRERPNTSRGFGPTRHLS